MVDRVTRRAQQGNDTARQGGVILDDQDSHRQDSFGDFP
jgi:hypothetical protein